LEQDIRLAAVDLQAPILAQQIDFRRLGLCIAELLPDIVPGGTNKLCSGSDTRLAITALNVHWDTAIGAS
jgi:hypothetical protein